MPNAEYTDPVAQFIDAARDAGMEIVGQVVPDGRLHRCRMAGDKRGKLNGWYVLYLDGIPAGSFGSWRTGMTVSWFGKSAQEMTSAETLAHKERMERAALIETCASHKIAGTCERMPERCTHIDERDKLGVQPRECFTG